MNLLILALTASGAAQCAEPAWREFYTLSDGRPNYEQVFSYDPASVRRRRHSVRVTLRSWQPLLEGGPVMTGVWRAEIDCARRRGVVLQIHQDERRGWSDQFGGPTRTVEGALIRTLCASRQGRRPASPE